MSKAELQLFYWIFALNQRCQELLVELITMRNTCASEGLLDIAIFEEKLGMDFAILRCY